MPVFHVDFAQDVVSVGDKLYVSLCSGKTKAKNPDVSFQIKLMDDSGYSIIININDFGGVINPIDAPIGKSLVSLIFGESEPVLQMVCIPTKSLEGLSGGIVSMKLVMDTVEAGKAGQTLYVDDLRVGK